VLSDKFKEPKLTVLAVFFLGYLICLPAGTLNDFSYKLLEDGTELSKRLGYSFLGPAWAEELLKFSILYLIVLRRDEFNEPMDGIVYGVAASLGFATYENYDYVFRLAEQWDLVPMDLAIWRSYSAIPMHGLNGCLMGFYFGKYAFTGDKKFLLLSLLIPFLMHGLYNFLDHPFSLIIVVILVIYSLILHSDLKKLQKSKKQEKETKKI
tara:strand:+ start:139 stop:765 length:627 start_codon:yes stop_codon:yes gene_type:complete